MRSRAHLSSRLIWPPHPGPGSNLIRCMRWIPIGRSATDGSISDTDRRVDEIPNGSTLAASGRGASVLQYVPLDTPQYHTSLFFYVLDD
jgi:hypothetical protein